MCGVYEVEEEVELEGEGEGDGELEAVLNLDGVVEFAGEEREEKEGERVGVGDDVGVEDGEDEDEEIEVFDPGVVKEELDAVFMNELDFTIPVLLPL